MSSNTEIIPQNIAVSVSDVSKTYRLYEKPSDRLKQAIIRHRRKLYKEVWAVKNVSFELPKGCAMGILGSNGAGKSTLLQLISGTLYPTFGEIYTRGRVLALLELGSSFNPQFTGRENIYFYGAALGLTAPEVRSHYDEIIAFADIGDFIEQPIKTYSSGMMMRLAFSVQAHIEPSVLIVDEALSVGDIHFQMKCMRHIDGLLKKGVSLLFVSHSPDMIKQLCDLAIWMDHGEIRTIGESAKVVEDYIEFVRISHMKYIQEQEKHEEVEEKNEEKVISYNNINWDSVPLLNTLDPSNMNIRSSGIWDDKPFQIDNNNYNALVSGTPCSTVAFKFNGAHIDLTFLRHQWSGKVRISIDDKEDIVDLYKPGDSLVYHYNRHKLEQTEHKVRIDLLEEKNPESKGFESWLLGAEWGRTEIPFRKPHQFQEMANKGRRYGSFDGKITMVELIDEDGQPVNLAKFGQKVTLRIYALSPKSEEEKIIFSFIVRNKAGLDLFGTCTRTARCPVIRDGEEIIMDFSFKINLPPGQYSILTAMVYGTNDNDLRPVDSIDLAYVFEVETNVNLPVHYLFYNPIEIFQRG